MRTNEEKRRIVEETLEPGVSLASVALKHGVNANLLFSWRRLHRRGLLTRSRQPAVLVPVAVTAEAPDTSGAGSSGLHQMSLDAPPRGGSSLEIGLPGGVVIRLQGAVDPTLLEAVLHALRIR